MNTSRLVLGIFAIGVATTFYVTALGYPDKAANMPLIYSVLVALLGTAMVGQELWSRLQSRKTSTLGPTTLAAQVAPEDSANGHEEGHHKPWKAMLVFLLAVGYLYSLSTLGYLVATVGFMALALIIIGHISWRFATIGIFLLVAVVCAVFIGFLGLPVPLLPPLFS
ncbi:tripartite tricarboxylate transporter TctB family protein [Halomonas sp. HMF6819]|uniref:tripartite tricarboxylate transporter TctB family protein n=1 Tax=Halomonas sp. HMF6819 TaxID=3373085 RepID=UPI0037A458AE